MADKKVKDKIAAHVSDRRAARKARVQTVKKEIRQRVEQRKNANRVTSDRLKLLVTVVGRSKAEYYVDLIQSFEVNMQMIAMARGTADAKMLGLLGLGDNEKTVIFSVIRESKIADAMATLDEKFSSIKDGKGVACTVPLTSVIGTLIYGFLSNNRKAVKEPAENKNRLKGEPSNG